MSRSNKYGKKNSLYSDFYRNYRVKIYGLGYNQLAGIPLLRSLLGDVLLEKVLSKACDCVLDSVSLKFRRGLKVTIYYK